MSHWDSGKQFTCYSLPLPRYADAASALEKDTHFGLRRFEVCDNVDLDTIVMEYESFYFIKFQKYPKLTKKLPEQGRYGYNNIVKVLSGCSQTRRQTI